MMLGRAPPFDSISAAHWEQRVLKEERAFLEGPPGFEDSTRKDRRRKHRSGRRDKRGESTRGGSDRDGHSPRGSAMGRRPSSHHSHSAPSLHHAGSAISRTTCRSGASGSTLASGSVSGPAHRALPDDLKAVARFGITETSVMTNRPKLQSDGLVPGLRFVPERVEAMWIPGAASFVKYRPEFVLEEPAKPREWE